MTGWLQLSDEQRRASLAEAAANSGINSKAIEKDWWVTLTLKALFGSNQAKHIVFKGGTSLSKGWKLIQRFSEDVDLGLDPAAFGMTYKDNPSKSYVKNLKRAGCEYTSNELIETLIQRFNEMAVPQAVVKVEAAPVPKSFPDTDPQTIFVHYPSLFPPIDYIPDNVKVEVSVRSLKTPFTTKDIQSLLNEYFPNTVYGETPFPVTVVEARKTFLEKAFLLHEEFQKPDKAKIRTERMSRHLYDLVSMMDTAVGDAALADTELYWHLIQHRQWYTGYTYMDYSLLGPATVNFIPPEDLLTSYHTDYERMKEEMIYDNALPFEELIKDLTALQSRFRTIS